MKFKMTRRAKPTPEKQDTEAHLFRQFEPNGNVNVGAQEDKGEEEERDDVQPLVVLFIDDLEAKDAGGDEFVGKAADEEEDGKGGKHEIMENPRENDLAV